MIAKKREISEILGISEEMVRKHTKSGRFHRDEKKMYDVGQVVRAYIEMLTDDMDAPGLTEERTRLIRAQADKAEMDLAAARLELWPRELCVETWATIAKTIQQKMMALKNEIKMHVPYVESDDLIKIDNIIRNALTELGESAVPRGIQKNLISKYGHKEHRKSADI